MALLRAVATCHDGDATLQASPAECGLNRSTAWRLLATLEHHGLVERRDGAYAVGHLRRAHRGGLRGGRPGAARAPRDRAPGDAQRRDRDDRRDARNRALLRGSGGRDARRVGELARPPGAAALHLHRARRTSPGCPIARSRSSCRRACRATRRTTITDRAELLRDLHDTARAATRRAPASSSTTPTASPRRCSTAAARSRWSASGDRPTASRRAASAPSARSPRAPPTSSPRCSRRRLDSACRAYPQSHDASTGVARCETEAREPGTARMR